ncbi:hypothetical protein ACWF95_41045 [Streptomyces vinaceus]
MRIPDVTLSIPDNQLQVVGTWTSRRLTSLPVSFKPRRQPAPRAAAPQGPRAAVQPEAAPAAAAPAQRRAWRFWWRYSTRPGGRLPR